MKSRRHPGTAAAGDESTARHQYGPAVARVIPPPPAPSRGPRTPPGVGGGVPNWRPERPARGSPGATSSNAGAVAGTPAVADQRFPNAFVQQPPPGAILPYVATSVIAFEPVALTGPCESIPGSVLMRAVLRLRVPAMVRSTAFYYHRLRKAAALRCVSRALTRSPRCGIPSLPDAVGSVSGQCARPGARITRVRAFHAFRAAADLAVEKQSGTGTLAPRLGGSHGGIAGRFGEQ